MTHRAAAQSAETSHHRLRFELILGSILLGLGLFMMPALIYWVGAVLLGPYGSNGTLGTFYGDFYGHLAIGSVRAWVLAVGPLILVSLLRLIFLRRPQPDSDAAPRQPLPVDPGDGRRVEPRISLD